MGNFLTTLLYYWWVPCTCLMYVLYGWLTKQNNVNNAWIWFWSLSICGGFPLWSFVSRTSKNLLVDGFMYDLCMLIAYIGTLVLLGEAEKFILNQWIGFALCIAGIILMKLRIGI